MKKKREDKLSGSYYTPHNTVRFMIDYLLREQKSYQTILEPSAGDGRFLEIFQTLPGITELTAVEIDKEKANDLHKRYPSVPIVHGDFLHFAENTGEKFQLIIGNPPYISIKNMTDPSKEMAKTICEKYQLPTSLMQNMWVAFVLAAVSCLSPGGCIFFVLPMEFLQVQYAEQIRLFLEKQFDSIHILSFQERMFPEIEQDSCLVYLTNAAPRQPHILFKIYNHLDSRVPCYESRIERNKPLKKWTNAILTDEDIDFLNSFDAKYPKVSDLCDASPGIVTGANNTFILTKKQVKDLDCQKFVLPTIPKSSMLNGKLLLTREVIEQLGKAGKRIYLLNLSHTDPSSFSRPLQKYLRDVGEEKNAAGIELRERYKCKERKPWYGVPIIQNGELFFFKRYDKFPRICVNEADAYSTDIAYNMRLHPGYNGKNLAFCFYNSLTLMQCEYYGRFYAGGVSELIPSEFKSLSVPYHAIDENDFMQLAKLFRKNAEIEEIISFVNSRTIEKDYGKEEIDRLNDVRRKLTKRRR